MTLDSLELRIGVVLKAGSMLSTALLALGLIVVLVAPLIGIGSLLIHAGLLILFATPILRVVVSLVGFFQQREWAFVWLTIAVLSVLAISAVAAFR